MSNTLTKSLSFLNRKAPGNVKLYLSSVYLGVKAYSYSTTVHASISVAWKNAKAKAPHIPGESLVKLAAVKIARIMCRGVQPSSTVRPSAHNQIGPRATAACVKLWGLDKSLAAHWRLAIPLTCVLCVCLTKSSLFHQAIFGLQATGCTLLP